MIVNGLSAGHNNRLYTAQLSASMVVNSLSAARNDRLYAAQQSAPVVVNGLSAACSLRLFIFKLDTRGGCIKGLHAVSIADKMNSSASHINNV